MESENKQLVKMSMLNPVADIKIPEPVENPIRGKEYCAWGADNAYPDYLLSLTEEVASLQAIIRSTVDYVCGESIKMQVKLPNFEEGIVNRYGETIEGLVKKLVLDKLTYGGYAIQVGRALDGSVAELIYKPFDQIRVDDAFTSTYWAPKWKYGVKAYKLPIYGNEDDAVSMLYEKGELTRTLYPKPFYYAGIKAAECEKAIDTYHLANVKNNFASNAIINLNNGVPSDDQKDEIERGINEKFAGAENAGRVMIMYNDTKESAATIEKLADDNSDKKYEELAKRCKEVIFTTAGMSPVLLGLTPEHNGFSKIEFSEAFNLYNKTRVQPLQQEIIRSFEKLLGAGCITIEPFKIVEQVNSQDNESIAD